MIGTSILKMRTRALKRVQTLMGSLGSQNTQPTLQERRTKETDTYLDIQMLSLHWKKVFKPSTAKTTPLQYNPGKKKTGTPY